jgi:hypothetical protein
MRSAHLPTLTALTALALGAGCISGRAQSMAEQRLHVKGKRLHMDAHDRIGDADVYVFCRRETDYPHHERHLSLLPRTYDGACVTIVCDGAHDDDCR